MSTRTPLAFCALFSCAVGCFGSGNPSGGFSSLKGSFSQIEGAIEDMALQVADDSFQGDLGDDRLGTALNMFAKAAEGTSLAADSADLNKKVTALGDLAATGPPVQKLREAVQDVQATVARIKSKL